MVQGELRPGLSTMLGKRSAHGAGTPVGTRTGRRQPSRSATNSPYLRRMIPAQVWSRVMRFSGERGRPGTAFVLDDAQGHLALVTAKHLCLPDESEEEVTLRHPWSNDGRAQARTLARIGDIHCDADVAAFRLPPGVITTPVGTVTLTAAGFYFTQDCYILGYPYGLSFTMTNDEDGQQLPLVKRGIIAGAVQHPGHRDLYLDLTANPGFSGGPVIIKNVDTQGFQVVGVVRGSLSGPLEESTSDRPEPVVAAAGISLASDASAVEALLARPR